MRFVRYLILGKVDIAVLSHGHYDHSGGLSAFARLNPSAAIYLQRRAGGEHYGYDGPGNGTEPFERMKAIMGDRLRYIRTGEEVVGSR